MQTFVLPTHLNVKAESFCAEYSTGSSKDLGHWPYPIPSPLSQVLALTLITPRNSSATTLTVSVY